MSTRTAAARAAVTLCRCGVIMADKKRYMVTADMKISCYCMVMASSREEAKKIAEGSINGDLSDFDRALNGDNVDEVWLIQQLDGDPDMDTAVVSEVSNG